MLRVPAPHAPASLVLAAVFAAALAAPAAAQYRPLPSSGYGTASGPVGEPYYVEFAYNIWSPAPRIVLSSESLGIAGTDINVQADLGVETQQTHEFRLVLRPGRKHKVRFEYLPMKYEADTTLTGEIIFNGIRFPVATQVGTLLEWKTYRIGYEWDFVSRSWGFVGMILQAKFIDANVELDSAIGNEYAHVRAPLPALGAIARVYIARYGSITGEFTGFKLPDSIDENYGGHDYEWNIYGTVNFSKNFGAQVGWRAHDFAYRVEQDRGSADLSGIYFGGVVRF